MFNRKFAYVITAFLTYLYADDQMILPRDLVKPDLSWDNVFYITGEYLLWQPHEDGLGYALETVDGVGSVKNLHFKYDSGFRVGLTYRMPHDKWELFTTWTWFYGKASGNTTSSSPSDIIWVEWDEDIFSNPPTQEITSMKSGWHVHINTLDGELGRYFRATDAVALRPHYGIRGAWIKQSFHTDQAGGTDTSGDTLINTHLSLTNYFKGVGPRAGLESEWQMWNHWSIYTIVGGSLLYGTFHLDQSEIGTAEDLSTARVFWKISDKINQVVPTTDFGLGLRWDDTFWDGLIGFRAQAGWEFNDYFQQNKFKHFNISSNSALSYESFHEDLTTQGFVLSFQVEF